MTLEERIKLQIISSYIGNPLTEEQMEFASDFTKNTISFSDPGTGKTHTLVAGLILAQTYHKVLGSLINCMSFTNAAVFEVSSRYEKLCKRCSVAPSVIFNTFHSLSNRIMKESYPTMKITSSVDLKVELEDLSEYMKDVFASYGEDLDCTDFNYVKKVHRAINDLNSSLTFHPEHIKKKYSFVNLNMNVEHFQEIRKKWFVRGILRDSIQQGDIPLYCLYALKSKPYIGERWKGKYKIMIVDEFQDLSLLHLHILSYVADTLIVIGDMKQQIYQFNGACPQIVREYMRLKPDAKVCNLTKSFRCYSEIAEFATRVIKPNDNSINCFEGISEGGDVNLVHRRDLNWSEIADTIYKNKKELSSSTMMSTMFLYRNNASVIPIVEHLYKLNIPFRCSRLSTIMEVPIFDKLCILANVAWQPHDPKFVEAALRLFPEFKNESWKSTLAPIQVMKQINAKERDNNPYSPKQVSIFDINFKYKEESSYSMLNAMLIARSKILERKSAGVVLNNLLSVYESFIIKGQWWRLDNDKEFYFNLVAPICNSKEYPVMFTEEMDKANKNSDYIKANTGVRCYTMHTAKGLEADYVYILDCDEGSFPNAKILKKKVEAGCYYDAACDIRSERNLLYVAITRAKKSVTISYSGDILSYLISTPNSDKYSEYDEIYLSDNNEYDDAEEFFKLFRLEVSKV